VLRYAPLLWLVGFYFLGLAAVLARTTWRARPGTGAAHVAVLLWAAVGFAQAVSAVLNGLYLGDWVLGLRYALAFTVLGWLVAAVATAAGASWQLRGTRHAADLGWLAQHTLLLALVALALKLAGLAEFRLETPVSLLAGGSEAVRFYASALFYGQENTLGESATRLSLLYPWPPALGIGSLALALIATRIKRWRWAVPAFVGALVGIVFSWSRLAMGAAVFIAVLYAFLRLPGWLQLAALTVLGAAAALLPVVGVDPIGAVQALQASVNEARSGSSQARDLIYEASWAGFVNSPWIGNGWIGESVHGKEYLPIGSHSTLYGVLYTGGLLTFIPLALAMAYTLLRIIRITWWAPDVEDRADGRVALCLWILLLLAARYESVYSLTLPCFFIFTWMGACLAMPAARVHPNEIPGVEHASDARRRNSTSAANPPAGACAGAFGQRGDSLLQRRLLYRRRGDVGAGPDL
jgi:hypothetical protein